MQFLKTLFWVALGIVLVLFSVENWSPVTIELWGGLAADVKKPILVLLAFLIGYVPTFLLYRARVWSLQRKLETAERNVAMAQMAVAAGEPISPDEQNVVGGADQRVTFGSSASS